LLRPDKLNTCVISGLRLGVDEIFAPLGCYAAYIDSCRSLGTTYRSSL